MRALILAFLALPLLAQADLSKLPDWAAAEARLSLNQPAPAQADAWVLLERVRFAYTGSGEIRQQTFRLVKVLEEQGIADPAAFVLTGLGGRASKVKSLKGWNLRPDGELVKISTSDMVSVAADSPDISFSTVRATTTRLERVVKGSLVAFESLEVIRAPQGPVSVMDVLQRYPIRRWELDLAKSEGWFTSLKDVQLRLETRNLAPWVREPLVEATHLVLKDIPERPRDEALQPRILDAEPSVWVAFLDPACQDLPSVTSWDRYAGWVHQAYAPKFQRIEPVPVAGLEPLPGLQALAGWLRKELTYKAIYMTPERGWVPEASAEVARRHYGDCKDLAVCLGGGAMALGLKPHPVLARIMDGTLRPDQPVNPYAFNHVILALELPRTLGLAAEVQTPAGRFLLVDATSRTTPLGWLPTAHRGGRLLICMEGAGVWVDVPEQAIEPEGLKVDLQGDINAEGQLEGTVLLKETGNFLNLRTQAFLADPKALKDHLVSELHLRENATLDVQEVTPPLDLSVPLTIKVRIRVPQALASHWGEWALEPIGLPSLPAVAQKPGQPRLYPVVSHERGRWTWTFDLGLPRGLVSRFPERSLDTPFRQAAWKGSQKGGRCQGELVVDFKDAVFGFDRREEGVREAKKNRTRAKTFEEEIVAFHAPEATAK